MNKRPIKKLAVQHGSIRQRSAREAIGPRYVAFYGSLAALCAMAWTREPPPFPWFLYTLAVILLLAFLRPWHRSLHVEMDLSILRTQVELLGFLPVAVQEYDLTGKRLGLGQNTAVVEEGAEAAAGLGCLAFALPFPLGMLLSPARDSAKSLRTVRRWVLCTNEASTGNTEHLLLLADRHVAAPFLDAVEEVLPQHVWREGIRLG